MGTKVSVTTLSGRYASIDALNANFQALADAFDTFVSRDGEAPNALTASLDVNSQRLLNLVDAVSAQEPVTLSQMQGYVATQLATINQDHGGMAGLGDDDHSQYLLASAAGGRAAFASQYAELRGGGDTTLHTHTTAFYTKAEVEARITSAIVAGTFIGHTDTPASYAGYATYLTRVNAGETALEFVDPTTVGTTNFLGLSDTPSSYSGQTLKALRVNAGETGLEFYSITLDTDSIALVNENTAAYSSLTDWLNLANSVGVSSGCTVTDGGSGTADIAAGVIFVRTTDSALGTLMLIDFAGTTGLALTNFQNNWIYISYNGGSPVAGVETSYNPAYNKVYVALVARRNSVLHISPLDTETGNHKRNDTHRNVLVEGVKREEGGIVSETGTRNIAISAAKLWFALERYSLSAKDTSVADTFTYFYRDGLGDWTEVPASTQINNTQYDDGSGTLATLSTNRYGVHWVYIAVDGDIYVQFGQGNYTLIQAEDAEIPAPPGHINMYHAILVAKIIIRESQAVFTSVQNTNGHVFSGSGAANHGDLTGLGDDDHTQYVLVTSLEADRATISANWSTLTDAGDASSLHNHASLYSALGHTHDHGTLSGLTDDDHTQYALLAGRSGGQTLIGSTVAGQGLTLQMNSTGSSKGTLSILTHPTYTVATFSSAIQFYEDLTVNTRTGTANATHLTVSNNSGNYAMLRVLQQGAGDMVVQWFNAGGSIHWSMGEDNSAADDFVLSEGITLGTNNVFSVASGTRILDFVNTPTVGGTAVSLAGHTHDHGTLTGLEDDDHTQYALLAGRAGGQTLYGGTGTLDKLTLRDNTTATSAGLELYSGSTQVAQIFATVQTWNASSSITYNAPTILQIFSTSSALTHGLRNDSTGGAHQYLWANNASGDAKISFRANADSWTIGTKNSDSSFVLARGFSDLTTTPIFSIAFGGTVVDFVSTPTVGGTAVSLAGHTHDHGTLTGLGDDDHTQYHNDTRGDVRYLRLNADSTRAAGSVTRFDNTAAEVIPGVAGGNRNITVFNATAGGDAFITFHVSSDFAGYFGIGGAENDLIVGGWSYGTNRYRVWHSGNDGAGSGLDADTVDGVQASSIYQVGGTDVAVADGGTGASTAAGARTNLGLVIGTNVQAWDTNLDQIAALAVTDGNFIVGNGSAWVAESGATARTSLGLGSLATASTINNSNWSGTDLSVANGGTGRSSHTAYAVICGGTTTTAAQQSIAGVGTSGQVLTSNGAGALPTFQTVAGGITLGTEQASTSGTAIDFTSIPAGTKRITIMGVGVSTNGTSAYICQIGDSGGIETTGYNSCQGYLDGAAIGGAYYTNGHRMRDSILAANTYNFKIVLTLEDSSDNTWSFFGTMLVATSASQSAVTTTTKALSATLDRVRITTTGGSNTFDAGVINIAYE